MNISLQLARPNSLETAVITQFKFDGKKRRCDARRSSDGPFGPGLCVSRGGQGFGGLLETGTGGRAVHLCKDLVKQLSKRHCRLSGLQGLQQLVGEVAMKLLAVNAAR